MGSVYSLGAAAGLGESWASDTSASRSTSAGGDANAVSASPSANDPKDTSTIPALSKVEELKGSNPSEFQHVVTDAVTQLKTEARQTSDPFAASFLWNLASRFELALDSGSASKTATGPDAA
jgi:hypothetical protein